MSCRGHKSRYMRFLPRIGCLTNFTLETQNVYRMSIVGYPFPINGLVQNEEMIYQPSVKSVNCAAAFLRLFLFHPDNYGIVSVLFRDTILSGLCAANPACGLGSVHVRPQGVKNPQAGAKSGKS